MTTLSQLRTDLREELKKDPNGRIWGDSALNRYINKAYFKVQKDGNFDWIENDGNYTFSLVSGTQEYAVPSDLGKNVLIRYNGTPLIKTSKTTLKRQYTSFVSGTPSMYYIYGAFIGFDVIPNVTGTIDWDYRKILTSLSDDADTIVFGTEFDLAIIKYAAFLAWSTIDGKENTASTKLQEYGVELDSLVSGYIFNDLNDLTFNTQRRSTITRADVLTR